MIGVCAVEQARFISGIEPIPGAASRARQTFRRTRSEGAEGVGPASKQSASLEKRLTSRAAWSTSSATARRRKDWPLPEVHRLSGRG